MVKAFLREAGVGPATLVLSDGSGLSRNDMITAEATIQLLIYMHRHRYAAAFRDSLPIAGVDGTLAKSIEGNARGKQLAREDGNLQLGFQFVRLRPRRRR